MSDPARRLREYLFARARRRGGRALGRRARWSAQHAEVFAAQARRALRGAQKPPEGQR